jgi:peptidoglycan/LPS O-acetylase OafA/YrhL
VRADTGTILADILANVSLTNGWFPNIWDLGINGGTWSLSVEMFFYALFPLVLVAMKATLDGGRRITVCLGSLWFLSALPGVMLALKPMDGGLLLYYSVPVYRFPEFLVGVAIAVGWRRGAFSQIASSLGRVVVFCALAFAGMTIIWVGLPRANLSLINVTAVPLVATAILYSAERRPKWLETDFTVYLGEISYGFYIYQFIFFAYLLPPLAQRVTAPISLVFGLSFTIGLASLSYRFLERPMRSWINQSKIFR